MVRDLRRLKSWLSPRLITGRARTAYVIAPLVMVCQIVSCNADPLPESAAFESKPSDQAAADISESELREGEDWPIFLGPQGTGISSEIGLAETWPKDGPPIIWSKEVGTGYSAPSVRGNRIVLHHRIGGGDEIVECLRADNGEPVWKYSYASGFKDPYGYNNGPRCSPLLTEDRCYTFGAEGKLVCLDLKAGTKVWAKDAKTEFDLPDWFFGISCTPVLEGNALIALVGGRPNSGVAAFDAQTGKTLWEAVGKQTWDGAETNGWWGRKTYTWTGEEQIVSYSSPIVASIHSKRHLLCLTRQGLVSLDPSDGSENFKYFIRPRVHESVSAARPLVIGNRIFLSMAYRVGSVMLEVAPDGKSVEEVWRNRSNLLTHWSTAIHVDGFIYGFSGRHEREGSFRCLSAETGAVIWQTNGFAGDPNSIEQDPSTGDIVDRQSGEVIPFPFYGRGSKILVDNKFVVLGERGTLSLVNVNPQKFEEMARTSYKQIHYPAWAAPVLSRKRLYLRCEDALLCLDLAK